AQTSSRLRNTRQQDATSSSRHLHEGIRHRDSFVAQSFRQDRVAAARRECRFVESCEYAVELGRPRVAAKDERGHLAQRIRDAPRAAIERDVSAQRAKI